MGVFNYILTQKGKNRAIFPLFYFKKEQEHVPIQLAILSQHFLR